MLLATAHATSALNSSALEYEVPAWSGDEGTEHAEWLNLTVAVGNNAPDVEGSTGDGVLSQTAEGAIVTGSMNIYNPVGASSFVVTDSVDGSLQTVVFQTWVSGTELNYDSLVLNIEGSNLLVATRTELGRETGGFGDTVVSKWEWDVSSHEISGFSITFASTGAHTSLVGARLDTQFEATPQPLAFHTPTWFGADGSDYSGWLNFTTAFGDNDPDVEGSTGDAVLSQTIPGAIITGSMNIYNPAGASVFEISDSVERPLQTVVFQSWTTGTELDYDGFVLEYNDGETQTLTATREEIGREAGGQGDTVVSLWNFALTGLGIQEFTIRVSALAAHSSLAAARLDTRMEPAPDPLAFDVPTWAGGTNAQYSGWLNFSTAVGDNSADIAESNGDAVLNQSAPGAIITGTLNIYNPAGASVFTVSDTVDSPLQTVVFQSWTTGTQLDYATMLLEYDDGSTQTLTTNREEVGRLAGGFGDEVVSKWSWDLAGMNVQSFSLSVSAAGPHTSLMAARLDTLTEPSGQVVQIVKNAPYLDRWNYPFNATPGTRAAAPIFSAGSDEGIDRHGTYIMGFDTGDIVTPGGNAASYVIESARLVATTTSNFEVAYDPTFDSVLTFLPEDHEQHVTDDDAGRPIELFGAGFRNGYDASTWVENAPYAPEGGERSVYPASLDSASAIIDVTEAVNFAEPVESSPFALGTFDGVSPGDLIPHDTAMTFDLNVSDPVVQSYLQMSLMTGRVFFTITGLPEGVQGAATRPYPEFATADSLLGDPPTLEMTVRVVEVPTVFEIATLSFEDGGTIIGFNADESSTYSIRHTSDFITWQTIENPELTFSGSGMAEWIDTDSPGEARFYQIVRVD